MLLLIASVLYYRITRYILVVFGVLSNKFVVTNQHNKPVLQSYDGLTKLVLVSKKCAK